MTIRPALGDTFAEFALNPGSVPSETLAQARLTLLDAVGCAIAGTRMPSGGSIARWAASRPGACPVLGLGLSSERETAAFAAAQLVNAMDFDPVSSAGHDVPAVVAASLVAVADAGGSGQDLLESIAVGLEVSTRLALLNRELAAEGDDVRYVGNPLFAPAVVTAVARAAGLSVEQCRHGLALAAWLRPTDTVADYFSATSVPMAKYALFGQLAQIGLTAADLARNGFTGPEGALEPRSALWRVGARRPWPALPARDGQWRHLVRHKLLPTNLPTIAVKAAFGDYVSRERPDPDDIERIVVEAGDSGAHAVMTANDLRTEEDGILHFPYQLACLALRIPVVSWMSSETRDRADVQAMMDRVEVRSSRGVARVAVATIDGVHTLTGDEGAGTLLSPSSTGDIDTLLAKFVDCAATVHGPERAARIAHGVLTVGSVRVLSIGELAPPPPASAEEQADASAG